MKHHFLDESTRRSLLQRIRHRTTEKYYRLLTARELEFFEQMEYHLSGKLVYTLSTKQFDWLISILERTEKEILIINKGTSPEA